MKGPNKPATAWVRYRYGNSPQLLPLSEGESTATKAEIRAAGFAPNDEEVEVSSLREEWNGHLAGSRVITGLTCEGHPFAVEK